MAPLPHNSTAVWYLDYETCGHGHTMEMRTGDDVVATDVSASFDAFITAHADLIFPIVPTGMRHSVTGSSVTLPVTYSGAASFGDGTPLEKDTANYFDYVGRGADGRRVRVALFGMKIIEWGGNYRVTPTEKVQVGDALDVLTADGEMWWNIGGGIPIWNTYANSGVNAYWRNKIR